MDCLEKVVHLLNNNYYIRKSANTRTGTDTRFDNFVSALNLSLGMGDDGLSPNVLKHIVCHGLNSILLREGRAPITGNNWDLEPSYLMAYASMGSVFEDVWEKQVTSRCMDRRYEFNYDSVYSAAIPYIGPGVMYEKRDNGVRISADVPLNTRLVDFGQTTGRFRFYPLARFFVQCPADAPGAIPWGAGHAKIENVPADLQLKYNSAGGVGHHIITGQWVPFHGGFISTDIATQVCIDLDINVISSIEDYSPLSPCNHNSLRPFLLPPGDEIAIDYVRLIRAFMSRFFPLPHPANHFLSLEYYERLALHISEFNFYIFGKMIMYLREFTPNGN